MVLAEHQLLDTAESIVEEAKKDRANGIAEQEIRKRLSVRLREEIVTSHFGVDASNAAPYIEPMELKKILDTAKSRSS